MEEFIQVDLKTILAEYTISGREIEKNCSIPRYKIDKYKKNGVVLKRDYEKLKESFPLVFSA